MKATNVLAVGLVSCAVLLTACSKGEKGQNFSLQPTSSRELAISSLPLETIKLDSVTTSYVIESSIRNGKIFLVDRYLTVVYEYDASGRFVDKHLGSGRARNETMIGRIETHTFTDDGKLFMLDANRNGYYFYDKDFLYLDYFRIAYARRDLNGSKIYSDPLAYTQLYNDMVCRSFKDKIYFNVHLMSPEFNIIATPDEHLKNCANILEVDVMEKALGHLLAVGYPKSYRENPYTKAVLSYVNFDVSGKGDFYVTYEADSLVYVYDNDFNMAQCYGFAGRDMDLNYAKSNTIEDFSKNYRSERNDKGYYNWTEYVDETGLLFRSYKKGKDRDCDGLQIYREGVLIGDVDVPKGLRVMGYIEPYYYSYIIPDEDNEALYMYKFEL